jgi:hypothetical protein
LLARLLQTEFRETRAEIHHTISPSFKQDVKQEEPLLRGLLHELHITLK